jgi:uncharacterized 2Fe-2S/4Fe-4S cluster protein (DUF4445 family)
MTALCRAIQTGRLQRIELLAAKPETADTEYRVIFQPAGRQGSVRAGISVLDAARRLGAEIESICGGRQTCGKCQVRIEEGYFSRHGIQSSADHVSPEPEREARYRQRKGLLPECRLSCAATVQGDLLVTVPEESRSHKQVVRKAATERAMEVSPAVRPYYVELPQASLADERSDWQRLRQEVADRFGFDEDQVHIDPAVLPMLQPTLRAGKGQLTATMGHAGEVIDLRTGYQEKVYGVAADVGTTTIVVHLCELLSGQILATESCMNPQISYGEDLMSRVSYVMEHSDGLSTLRSAVVEALNGLIAGATAAVDLQPADVVDLVVVGNTIMHHILLGIDPAELGGAPFALAVKDPVNVKARDLGLAVARGAYVHVPPLEAGHVGADNVAAIIAEAPHQREDVTLLIDVGTNGEIVLGNRTRLLSASSPTGPAFEGAQVRHGMRAAPGAIERVRIDPATLAVTYQIIGRDGWVLSGDSSTPVSTDGEEPSGTRKTGRGHPAGPVKASGICGSGIIEAIAELLKAGLLDKSGRFVEQAPTPRLRQEGRKQYFILAWSSETSTGQEIVVHADDVRAIQLAKAALYAGAKLLMRHYELSQVDRIVLAGAFGSYIDPEHAMVIGMIPDCDLSQVFSVGNAAGDGALIMLLDGAKRQEAAAVARSVNHIQTATDPYFQEEFVGAIHFPHMSDAFPHLDAIMALSRAQRIVDPSRNGHGNRRSRRARRRQRQSQNLG